MLLVEDPNLLAEFRAGQPAALSKIYAHYLPDVERALTRGFPFRDGERSLRFFGFSRSYELADAVQDTFLKAFQPGARMAFNGTDPYKPYLLQMARNVVIDKYRRARIRPDRLGAGPAPDAFGATGDDLETRTPATGDDPEAATLRAEASSLVADFVSVQDAATRELLRLHFEEEESQETTAAALGLRRSELRSQVELVRGRLLRFLKARGFIETVDRAAVLRALEAPR